MFQKKKIKFDKINNKTLIILMVSISLCVVLIAVGSVVLKEWLLEKRAQERVEAEIAEKERLEEERLQTIEKALDESEYESELRALYAENPQMEAMLLNMDAYDEWMIEHMIEQPDALDWVIAYPEYSEKSEQELEEKALQPLVLSEYQSKNQIPILYQWDEKWGYTSYGGNKFAITGCAPTCLSMVAVSLTNDTSLTPKRMGDLSTEINAYVEGVGTSWDLMTTGADYLGLYAQQLDAWSANALCSELKKGDPIICSMGEGDFTSQGHFIVLAGVTDEGMIQIIDPNSRMNTEKEWHPQKLLDQMKGMWSFTNQ